MNSIAMKPNTTPLPSSNGTMGRRSGTAKTTLKIGSPPKMAVANQAEVTLEMAIGVRALNEKCRSMASCAKMIPAIGAWKPAAIAAATPQPINTSISISLLPNI